jgi:MFS transporter, PPP family, 3-phenylpropionic acid transporter
MQKPSILQIWFPAYYFVFFVGFASLTPFMALYYEQRGLSGSQIGLLAAILPLVSLVAGPLWSGFADATRRHKGIFLFTTAGVVFASLSIYNAGSLAWLVPAVIVFAFLAAPILPLVDSSTMSLLGGHKDRYGKIRVWGTLGWAIGAPLTGWLVERSGVQWSFYMYALLMVGALLIGTRLPIGHTHISVPFRDGMRRLFSNPRWVFFLLVIFISGIANAGTNTYLFLYMDRLGADKWMIGLALTISTVSEVPVLFFADRLLRRFKVRGLILMALSIYIVRLLLSSFVGFPPLLLAIQLLHGFTTPTLFLAGVSYVAEIAPPGTGATAQALFVGVLNGLGAAAGAFIGGLLFESVGPVILFRVFALILLANLLLFGLFEKRVPSINDRPLDISV